MSTAGELFRRCAGLGITLSVDSDGDLAVSGPTHNLDRMLPEIREHHDKLLEFAALWHYTRIGTRQ